jgi:hypothetical protein
VRRGAHSTQAGVPVLLELIDTCCQAGRYLRDRLRGMVIAL